MAASSSTATSRFLKAPAASYIGLLADRLIEAMAWLDTQDDTRGLPVGLFGESTGGGAHSLPPRATPTE